MSSRRAPARLVSQLSSALVSTLTGYSTDNFLLCQRCIDVFFEYTVHLCVIETLGQFGKLCSLVLQIATWGPCQLHPSATEYRHLLRMDVHTRVNKLFCLKGSENMTLTIVRARKAGLAILSDCLL